MPFPSDLTLRHSHRRQSRLPVTIAVRGGAREQNFPSELHSPIMHPSPGCRLSLRPETRAASGAGGVWNEEQRRGHPPTLGPCGAAPHNLAAGFSAQACPRHRYIGPNMAACAGASLRKELAEVRNQGLLPAFLAGVAWASFPLLQVPREGDPWAFR